MYRRKSTTARGLQWVPSLYLTESIPYMFVMSVSVIMYKNLGLENTEIAAYTSLLNIPWVIKPLWSPFVDLYKTKREWVVITQFLMGLLFAGVAFVLPLPWFFQLSMALLFLIAFTSATHDIAADGFYMLGLSEKDQSLFVGLRSVFYRLGMFLMQGPLVYLTGVLAKSYQNDFQKVWTSALLILGAFLVGLAVYHHFFCPKVEQERTERFDFLAGFRATLISFFVKKNIAMGVLFILLFRLGEAQLLKLVAPFMLDAREVGGLGLDNEAQGLIYGSFGVGALIVGGLAGGWAISKFGLKKWIFWMTLSLNIPNLGYAVLAYFQPENILWVGLAVVLEQLGYGFGFTALMMFMIYLADGPLKTSHYAFCTAFMAAGVMFPGMVSGWLQTQLGYTAFFLYVFFCGIPALLLLPHLKIPADFGKKQG
ncbi:MFS transporter [Persicobacter sp. CCB-QB2]|uniref:MFS transporter n=1 Tax=Persicobacter sp. CCB-QB2 TaxID=1561025 RepID=UPI0006A9FE17|nr:MFS transporter [Persicobacter sp. CCB-QB2]